MDKIQRAIEIHRTMTTHQMAMQIVELQDALELAEGAVRAKQVPTVPDGCNAEQMTLDEAIVHANEKSLGNSQCATQHAQLAKWLTDYRTMLAELEHTK